MNRCTIVNDLSITKTVNGQFISGGLVTFTLAYQNTGPDTATGVTITDFLGTGLSGMSASPAWNFRVGNTFYRTGINLASGDSAAIVFTAMVVTGGGNTVYNTGMISFTNDPFTGNNISVVSGIVEINT